MLTLDSKMNKTHINVHTDESWKQNSVSKKQRLEADANTNIKTKQKRYHTITWKQKTEECQ